LRYFVKVEKWAKNRQMVQNSQTLSPQAEIIQRNKEAALERLHETRRRQEEEEQWRLLTEVDALMEAPPVDEKPTTLTPEQRTHLRAQRTM
jgi:hypothetical protein